MSDDDAVARRNPPDVGEAGRAQRLLDGARLEAEAQVAHPLSHRLLVVGQEVCDDDAAAGAEHPRSFDERGGNLRHVVEDEAQEHRVDRAVLERKRVDLALLETNVARSDPASCRGESSLRMVDGDHLLEALAQHLGEKTVAAARVDDAKLGRRQRRHDLLAQAANLEHDVEIGGAVAGREVLPAPLAAPFEHDPPTLGIAAARVVVGKALADGSPQRCALVLFGQRIAIERPGALAAPEERVALAQQPQVVRDPRLAHIQHVRDLVDRQLLAFHGRKNPQTGRIGEKAEQTLHGGRISGNHDVSKFVFSVSLDASGRLGSWGSEQTLEERTKDGPLRAFEEQKENILSLLFMGDSIPYNPAPRRSALTGHVPVGKETIPMDGKQRGFTLIEILVVVTIIGVLAGLVVVLIPRGQFEAQKVDCMNNVRNITNLIENTKQQRYPNYAGANLILYLVNKGELVGKDNLKLLFCPGDVQEDFEKAGGLDAFKDIDLQRKAEYGRLTSYAGRDQLTPNCAAKKGAAEPVVLVCDDSEDHHDNKGFVVGLTGGAAKYRNKVDDWSLRHDAEVTVGEGSSIDELTCLRVD